MGNIQTKKAAYFVTVCTANRERFFGKINNGEMTLSEIGKTAQTEWLKTPELRPDMNITLDAYVIMPDHFHGIIVIGGPVGTQCIASLPSQQQWQWQSNQFAPQSKNLAAIMRGFKSAVTKFATMNNIPFAWQTRFHDRVIRNYNEYKQIMHYINTNIKNWQDDTYRRNALSVR